MKIAIDFREAAKTNRAGKGEYALQLVRALIKLHTADTLILLVEPGQSVADLPTGNWEPKVVPAHGWLWHLWVVAWLEFARPVKLYFSPTSCIVPALVRSVKTITIIHDFTTWRFPAKHLPRAVLIERWFLPLALKSSNHLLVISEFTKQEAVALFHVPASKMTIALGAVDSQFAPIVPTPATISAIQQKYHLPTKYLLYLGTIEPRKNLSRLIEAWQQVGPEFPEYYLILAGGVGWYSQEIVDQAKVSQRVILPGYIDDADRPLLFSLSEAFVFPSLYEGFGLPPLEAMATGVPVITSRVASLPEVVGQTALLVDPEQVASIADAIKQLLFSADLRESLRRQGPVQAAKFTWGATAKTVDQVFHHYD